MQIIKAYKKCAQCCRARGRLNPKIPKIMYLLSLLLKVLCGSCNHQMENLSCLMIVRTILNFM